MRSLLSLELTTGRWLSSMGSPAMLSSSLTTLLTSLSEVQTELNFLRTFEFEKSVNFLLIQMGFRLMMALDAMNENFIEKTMNLVV